MSLTSYLAAPSRGVCFVFLFREVLFGFLLGLAVPYSPTP